MVNVLQYLKLLSNSMNWQIPKYSLALTVEIFFVNLFSFKQYIVYCCFTWIMKFLMREMPWILYTPYKNSTHAYSSNGSAGSTYARFILTMILKIHLTKDYIKPSIPKPITNFIRYKFEVFFVPISK